MIKEEKKQRIREINFLLKSIVYLYRPLLDNGWGNIKRKANKKERINHTFEFTKEYIDLTNEFESKYLPLIEERNRLQEE